MPVFKRDLSRHLLAKSHRYILSENVTNFLDNISVKARGLSTIMRGCKLFKLSVTRARQEYDNILSLWPYWSFFQCKGVSEEICYVSSQGIFQIKANGKWKDLFNAFIWACCGFFWSRGLQIKLSGFGDKKEWKRPKEADLAKTAQRQGQQWVHLQTGLNYEKATSHLQYRLITWHCFR